MATSASYRHYLRVLNRWPKDLLRPEVSFQDALYRQLDRRYGPVAQVPSKEQVPGQAVSKPNEKAEMEQVNALYSLLENRYSNQYPLSESFMKPASNPTHYIDLLNEMEEAPKRSWLAQRLNKWKGFLRFS